MAQKTAVFPTTASVGKKANLLTSKKFQERLSTILSTVLVTIGACLIMIPVIWMISTSLKVSSNISTIPPEWIPMETVQVTINGEKFWLYDVKLEDGTTKRLAAIKLNPTRSEFADPNDPTQVYYAPADNAVQVRVPKLHFENYMEVWTFRTTPFGVFMVNTLKYTLWAVFFEVLVNSFVAFGFARMRAPGKNVLFLLILSTMMLPYAVTMIPSYVLFTRYIPDFLNGILGTSIKFADTWVPLMAPKLFGSAYLIFLIRQFYMSIPKDYDEAARIDGAGWFQIWSQIILPMSRPVLVAVAILSFMFHWNDYMGPLIYLNSTQKLPISVGLAQFQASYGGTPWHLMMGGSLIAVLPLVLIFFALNRYFVQGIVVSGIKG